jgi:hypothetical protein
VNGFEVAAVIVAVFFGLGIATGVFLVMALPALRQHRYVKRHPENEAWRLPPGPPQDDTRPRWPGA